MKTPPYLKSGDKIAIIATARKISETELLPAVKKFNEWGFEVVLGKNIYAIENQYAGNDVQRLSDIQDMINDPSIKAIVCARGGYGTIRFVDKINFSAFIKNPKWIVGYSDITILHSHIHTNYKTESIHAIMPLNFPADGKDNNALHTLYKALTGDTLSYTIKHDTLSKHGNASGILVGGNLSLLYALASTPSDINTDGKILFIEDLDEYLYHIDRMMHQLKRSGKLKNLAGLIVGGMTDMKDNTVPFGKTAYEIISDTVKEYNYPVCMRFPAGHMDDNRALIIGRNVSVNIGAVETRVDFL